MKRILTILLCVIMASSFTAAVPMSAEVFAGETASSSAETDTGLTGKRYTVDGLKYEVTADSSSKKTVKVTGASKTSVCSIRIPASVKIKGNTYKVTAVAGSAFKGYKKLSSAAIASGVTSLGSKAFANCAKLTKVTGCTEVTKIGEYAFYGCSALKNVNNCQKVTSIGKKAFCRCSNLKRVGTETGVTSLSKLKSIGSYAFYECKKLTAVNIPSNVKNINQKAFCRCTSLTKVTGCKNVETIKKAAFYGCTKLSRVSGCRDVTAIDSKAFCRCSKLKRIGTMTETVSLPEIKTIGSYAFYGCKTIHGLYEEKTFLKSIGSYAFKNCTNLETVHINSEKLNSIGKQAFYGDKNLKLVTMLNTTKLTVSNVKPGAFKGINGKCKFRISPSASVSKYKKVFKNSGAPGGITVEKKGLTYDEVLWVQQKINEYID